MKTLQITLLPASRKWVELKIPRATFYRKVNSNQISYAVVPNKRQKWFFPKSFDSVIEKINIMEQLKKI